MPIYTLKCSSCGNESQYLVGMVENNVNKCKNCGGEDLTRVFEIGKISVKRKTGILSGLKNCSMGPLRKEKD